MIHRTLLVVVAVAVGTLLLSACSSSAATQPNDFVFGVVMVGPFQDHGWSEAHYAAGQYVEKQVPGARMLLVDKLNPADRPGVTLGQVVGDMVGKGARLILTTSDDFQDDTDVVARKYPRVTFVNVSGDHVLTGAAPANVGNLMARIETVKGIAGCAAAMATTTGKIGYVGPLINPETRRIASAAYLGARQCYQGYRGLDPEALKFKVEWIGFWFNIPGQTQDPVKVSNALIDEGYDVLLSGLDTIEALQVTADRQAAGARVYTVPYLFNEKCAPAPRVCLGVPFVSWGPSYVGIVKQVKAGTWKRTWEWVGVTDWKAITSPDSSSVGFAYGPALPAEDRSSVQDFINDLASGKAALFRGPLRYNDGSPFLAAGETATDRQVWYLPKLVQGMEGPNE